MSYITLPFRIRPSRARLSVLGGILAAVSVPIVFADLGAWPQVLAVLSAPAFTASFAGAVALALFGAIYLSFLIGFVLVAWPGAPLLHVDVDARGVTYRRLWHVTRVSFREADGFGYVERGLIPVSANVRASTRLYAVVAGSGGFDGHRLSDDRPYAMAINVLPFTPLLESRESFAQDVAMCLSAAVRGARQARRPIVIDVGPAVAALACERAPQLVPTVRPVRAPGRRSSHDAPWRGQTVRAARMPDSDRARR
jgi:hypothetical protein